MILHRSSVSTSLLRFSSRVIGHSSSVRFLGFLSISGFLEHIASAIILGFWVITAVYEVLKRRSALSNWSKESAEDVALAESTLIRAPESERKDYERKASDQTGLLYYLSSLGIRFEDSDLNFTLVVNTSALIDCIP